MLTHQGEFSFLRYFVANTKADNVFLFYPSRESKTNEAERCLFPFVYQIFYLYLFRSYFFSFTFSLLQNDSENCATGKYSLHIVGRTFCITLKQSLSLRLKPAALHFVQCLKPAALHFYQCQPVFQATGQNSILMQICSHFTPIALRKVQPF